MLRFLKRCSIIFVLLFSLPAVHAVHPALAVAYTFGLSFVCVLVVFKWLPQLKIAKGFAIAIFMFAGLPGVAMSLVAYNEPARMAELRKTDPDAYLENLAKYDRKRYTKELALLKPKEFAAQQERDRLEYEQQLAAEQAEAARLAAVAQRRADDQKREADRAEAERLAKQSEIPRRLTSLILDTLESHYDTVPEPQSPNEEFCSENGYCVISLQPFSFAIYGLGIVDLPTTTQAPHSTYRELCAAAFSAISGSELTFSREVIDGSFIRAAANGAFKHDEANTQIKIFPDANGLMSCHFFKH